MCWKSIVDAVHSTGGRIIAQLMHAGALSQANCFCNDTAGPSAIQPRGEQLAFYGQSGPYRKPRAMSGDDIEDAISGFVQAADLAVSVAGFDGVEIHGANGYLLDEFLTNYTNERVDKWGGDIQRRVQLAARVVREVRQRLGDGPQSVFAYPKER